jgi:hypothetical protein
LFLTAMSDPSGKNLIYTVGDEEEENTIYSYSFRSGASEEILNGKQIVFSILDSPEKVVIFDVDNEDEAVLVYTCDVEGGNLVEVLDEELIDFEGVFHASGQKSIFFLFETEDGMALYATSTDSDMEGYYLAEDWFDIRLLTQSTNDETLIFEGMEDDGDDFSLYSVEIAENGRIVELDDSGDRFVNAVFTPNNKSVLYTVVTGTNPDDVVINQVNAFGEGRSEELFDEAVLVDVAWGDMQLFGFETWFVVQQGTSYCPGATLLVDATEVDSELVDEEGTCFRMTAAEGDVVTFAAYTDQPSTSFDLMMSLYDRDGFLLDENDDGTWSLDPRLTYTFEDSGIFFLKVTERNDEVGEFRIGMDIREDALKDARRIEIDDQARGTITTDAGVYLPSLEEEFYGDVYYFEAEEEDLVAIDVVASSLRSDLDPAVLLLDADGELLGMDDNGGEGNDARLFYSVATSGRYYFVIADADGGQPPSAGDDFSYEVSISYREGVNVAILNQGPSSSITYFNGTNENSYELVVNLLQEDDSGYFINVDVITDLSPSTLSQYDRLVLPDNAVPDDDLDVVDSWFTSGKTILAMDSAVCYMAYMGYMWSDVAGSDGRDYWDYRSIDGLEIVESSGTTSGFSVGQSFSTVSSDAWLLRDQLPSDANVLAVYSKDSNITGIAERNVSGKGKIVFFGPYVEDFSVYAELVANALR